MQKISAVRVLWLLNHTSLRIFEVDQLNRLNIKEIYTPKSFPVNEGNLSADIDYSHDVHLTIPKEDLDYLNLQNWYEKPSIKAWEIANKYFDIAVIGFFPEQIKATIDNFQGAIILRAFGLANGCNYTGLLYELLGPHIVDKIRKLHSRFWFGAAYKHLHEIEGALLKERNCYLPVGLKTIEIKNEWVGEDKRILFVCPRINSSSYFNNIYQNFIADFDEFKFTIAGAQPIAVNDKRVTGFLPLDEYKTMMQSHRVMFYHSIETNHIHYHPFEAIKIGMPLVFMAGGLLDKIGGLGLWGRSKNIKDAKSKIKKLLNDSGSLVKTVQKEQRKLLQYMDPEYCYPHHLNGYQKITQEIASKKMQAQKKPLKIAIICPIAYRGGSLRGAICLANSLVKGAKNFADPVEFVFAYLDIPEYSDSWFIDLDKSIKIRTYNWKNLAHNEAKRAMIFAGHSEWEAKATNYCVPDDGINQFFDCNLWLFISDRIGLSLLPVRPYVLMIYDYIQRYLPLSIKNCDQSFFLFNNAREAQSILTTTQFTTKDAMQFAGIESDKIFKMPMLVPDFKVTEDKIFDVFTSDFFIWTTNSSVHKNHKKTFEALEIYYEELDGSLNCHITGVGADKSLSKFAYILERLKNFPKMRKSIKFLGELSDFHYKQKLQDAAFLLHSALVDNGTFSVLEAALRGTPSLSNDYPSMREIDKRFNLELCWMDATNERDMAIKLKEMEKNYPLLKQNISQKDAKQFMHTEKEEIYYWEVIKKCL